MFDTCQQEVIRIDVIFIDNEYIPLIYIVALTLTYHMHIISNMQHQKTGSCRCK